MWRLFATQFGATGLLLRLVLGCVMFPHGAQKAFGWFGGPGFEAAMAGFARMGIPWALGLLAVLAELLGSLGLIVGLFTRLAALGIAVNMTVAIVLVHAPMGLFMNWQGNQSGEGFEYHLLAIALALALLIRGGGSLSIDRRLAHGR